MDDLFYRVTPHPAGLSIFCWAMSLLNVLGCSCSFLALEPALQYLPSCDCAYLAHLHYSQPPNCYALLLKTFCSPAQSIPTLVEMLQAMRILILPLQYAQPGQLLCYLGPLIFKHHLLIWQFGSTLHLLLLFHLARSFVLALRLFISHSSFQLEPQSRAAFSLGFFQLS